jgi:hypothetical protein
MNTVYIVVMESYLNKDNSLLNYGIIGVFEKEELAVNCIERLKNQDVEFQSQDPNRMHYNSFRIVTQVVSLT